MRSERSRRGAPLIARASTSSTFASLSTTVCSAACCGSAFFPSLRTRSSSTRRLTDSRACSRRYANASPVVTASIRRAPAPTELSLRIANGPISAVDRTRMPNRPVLRRGPHVRAAAELDRPAADVDDAHDLAVLLSEEHHRSELARLVDRSLVDAHRQVLEHLLVRALFPL